MAVLVQDQDWAPPQVPAEETRTPEAESQYVSNCVTLLTTALNRQMKALPSAAQVGHGPKPAS